jgi:MATE family multidrug resistance protein
LFALGIPIGVTFLVDVTSFTFMALFIARLGAVNSAAHQIASNVAAVMFMLPLAVGNGVAVLVAQAIGARKLRVARDTGLTGIALALVLAAVATITLAIGATAIAAFYSTDDAVRALAATLLVLVAGYHIFDALYVVNLSALRGYKRAVIPMITNAAALWGVGLGGGYVIGLTNALDLSMFGLVTPLGARGFWIAATVGLVLASVAIVTYFLAVSARVARP